MSARFRLHAPAAKLLTLAAILALAVVVLVALAGSKAAGQGQPRCGDTITTDVTLHHDLVNCPNNGIIIGADNITLDLNYHTIDGDGKPAGGCDPQTDFCDTGVVNFGHDGVTVVHGSLRQFGGAVNIFGPVQHNRLLDVSASRNADVGIQLFKSSKSVIRRSSASGSPNRHNLGFGLALYSSHHLRIVGSSFRNNTGDGLHTVDSNRNLFARNRVAHNGGEGFVLEGGEGNEIRRNRFLQNGGAGVTLDPGIENVIMRNHVTGGSDGIRIANGRGNLIAHNTVVGTARAGIRLGLTNPLLGGSHNTVRRNLVRASRHDGFVVMSKDGHSPLKSNLARGARDDGFDIESRSTKLTRNKANRNHDLGIEAVRGVRDGGGNVARHNGDRRQCRNIRCR
jgi:parallel beta-helix repeat protein